jgi:hypothetical protein
MQRKQLAQQCGSFCSCMLAFDGGRYAALHLTNLLQETKQSNGEKYYDVFHMTNTEMGSRYFWK